MNVLRDYKDFWNLKFINRRVVRTGMEMLAVDDNPPFIGFSKPKTSYYRLPNQWHSSLQILLTRYTSRAIAPIKVLEYIIKHTWGVQNFSEPIALTISEIRNGKKTRRGYHIDRGTQLSENSVRKALTTLVELGYIEVLPSPDEKPLYRIVTCEEEQQPTHSNGQLFCGWQIPEKNYFQVPATWTDLCSTISSSATILIIEYFFRHAWGYQNDHGIWLSARELATGRRYATGKVYDEGTGLDLSTVYRALSDAVNRGFLVWAKFGTEKYYNLRYEKMPLSLTGEFNGKFLEDFPIDGERTWGHAPHEEQRTAAIRNLEAVVGTVEESICKVEDPICNSDEQTCNVEGSICEVEGENSSINTLYPTPSLNTFNNSTPKRHEKLQDFVAAVYRSSDEILTAIGVVGAQKYSGIPFLDAVAWIFYSYTQNLKSPTGYLVSRLRSHEPPPQNATDLIALPINQFFSLERKKIEGFPPKLKSIFHNCFEDFSNNNFEQKIEYSEEATALWRTIVQALEEQAELIPRADLLTWIKPARARSWDGITLSVCVINPLAKVKIDTYFRPLQEQLARLVPEGRIVVEVI